MTQPIDQRRLPACVRVALDEGNVDVIRELAEKYSEGVGVRKNRRVAFILYMAGANLRDAEMAWRTADALEYGEGTPKSLVKSVRYLRLAVKLGSIGATTALGEHLWRCARSDEGRREAIKLYRRAANHGEAHALHNLGVCYSSGIGVRKNLRTAYAKFLAAAELGHTEAAFKVGWCLLYGEGVLVNRKFAMQWLRRAARSGHRSAANLLKN